AVHRTRGELQNLDGVFEQATVFGREATGGLRLRHVETCVLAAGAGALSLACFDDARAHDGAGFAGCGVVAQRARWQARHFDVQVDAIHQRTRHARGVALDGFGRTAATARGVAGPAARARIHRGDELEARGKTAMARGARDG